MDSLRSYDLSATSKDTVDRQIFFTAMYHEYKPCLLTCAELLELHEYIFRSEVVTSDHLLKLYAYQFIHAPAHSRKSLLNLAQTSQLLPP